MMPNLFVFPFISLAALSWSSLLASLPLFKPLNIIVLETLLPQPFCSPCKRNLAKSHVLKHHLYAEGSTTVSILSLSLSTELQTPLSLSGISTRYSISISIKTQNSGVIPDKTCSFSTLHYLCKRFSIYPVCKPKPCESFLFFHFP